MTLGARLFMSCYKPSDRLWIAVHTKKDAGQLWKKPGDATEKQIAPAACRARRAARARVRSPADPCQRADVRPSAAGRTGQARFDTAARASRSDARASGSSRR